jgi:homoserine kinase type II
MTGGGGLAPAAVLARLAADWDLADATVSTLDGGMNSQTWFVEAVGSRFVTKAVPVERRETFEAGLAIATIVEAAGVRSGAPILTRDGSMAVAVDGRVLALLRFVDGTELTGESIEERALIGSTLGRVHLALAGHAVAEAGRFPWLGVDAPHLSVRPWIRPAIVAAMAAWGAIPPESLTWGLLHTDPAPEAFRLDPATGECGLIDWDLGIVGPLLYDLASAEMYVGGPARSGPLIEAYLATGALPPAEVDRALRPLAQMRWAVQADYFAKRIATDDRTGIEAAADNEKGLEDARRGLIGA